MPRRADVDRVEGGTAHTDRGGDGLAGLIRLLLPNIVTTILGAGLLSFLFVSWTEKNRQFEVNKAEAYVNFLKYTWNSNMFSDATEAQRENNVEYLRSVSALTVYAPKGVLNAYHDYANCAARAGSSNEMRDSLGEDKVDNQILVEALWK
jgi:hypothetical protein